jgi:hypothetical protein
MRVDEKQPFHKFLMDRRFRGRPDCNDLGLGNALALVSKRYFYFGKDALNLSRMPAAMVKNLTKTGPGFRRDYPANKLPLLTEWFEKRYEIGIHGDSCVNTLLSLRPRLNVQSVKPLFQLVTKVCQVDAVEPGHGQRQPSGR